MFKFDPLKAVKTAYAKKQGKTLSKLTFAEIMLGKRLRLIRSFKQRRAGYMSQRFRLQSADRTVSSKTIGNRGAKKKKRKKEAKEKKQKKENKERLKKERQYLYNK